MHFVEHDSENRPSIFNEENQSCQIISEFSKNKLQDSAMEFLLASVLFLVIGTCASDFCNTCDSKNEYCEFGCCGEGETKRCCENKIAIGIGTAFGGLVLILVASGAFLYLMQRRYYKEKQFVHQTEASTQYDNDPLSIKGTVYLIGPDNRGRRLQVERSTEIQDEERNNNQHEVINEEN